MNAPSKQPKARKDIAQAVQWLRAHAQPARSLHADTRSLEKRRRVLRLRRRWRG